MLLASSSLTITASVSARTPGPSGMTVPLPWAATAGAVVAHSAIAPAMIFVGCNKRSASHQKSTHNSTAFRKHLYALRRCKPFIGCNKRSALRRQPSAFRRPSGDAPRFGPTKLYRPETQPMFFTFFQAMPEIFDSVQSRNPTAAKAKISAAAALRRVLPHALF